jgi:staphyloferrin B biosynthesis citrate synthase
MGGDRHIPRQIEYIKKGARFLTTNSEIAFILAEATRVTTELRRALADK